MVFVHAVHRAEVSYFLCGSRACNSQHGAFFLIVLLPGRSSRTFSVAFMHATYRTKLPFFLVFTHATLQDGALEVFLGMVI